MNIFYLHPDPLICSRYHCDKHVVKMILESCQLLSTAHHVIDGSLNVADGIYKKTHHNHPCAIWVRETHQNYIWLYNLMRCLHAEWHWRWQHNKPHKSEPVMIQLRNLPMFIPRNTFTMPPRCMPEEYKDSCVIKSYQNYYLGAKKSMLYWKNRDVPYFAKEGGAC